MKDNYLIALKRALKNPEVTLSVGDVSMDYYDLEKSRDYSEIVEACEATEMPVIEFYEGEKSHGQMAIMVGEGDESIIDHHYNDFMVRITEDL